MQPEIDVIGGAVFREKIVVLKDVAEAPVALRLGLAASAAKIIKVFGADAPAVKGVEPADGV